jgi:hypothetical protein
MGGRNWPHRYRVAIRNHGDNTITYQAVTLRTAEKAIALAVSIHERRNAQDSVSNRISDVEVEDLGPVSLDEKGKAVLEGADLVDRMEF